MLLDYSLRLLWLPIPYNPVSKLKNHFKNWAYFFNWAIAGLFFFIFAFPGLQLTDNYVRRFYSRCWDSNRWSLLLKATGLPTAPQPQPRLFCDHQIVLLWLVWSDFCDRWLLKLLALALTCFSCSTAFSSNCVRQPGRYFFLQSWYIFIFVGITFFDRCSTASALDTNLADELAGFSPKEKLYSYSEVWAAFITAKYSYFHLMRWLL